MADKEKYRDLCKHCSSVKENGICPKCGVPAKYTIEELVSKTQAYIDKCRKSIIRDDKGKIVVDTLDFPSIAGLASELDISRETIRRYSTPGSNYYNPVFCGIIQILLADQERYLVERGLTGLYNSTIAKLILTKHGYSDKQEIDARVNTYEEIRKQKEKYSK